MPKLQPDNIIDGDIITNVKHKPNLETLLPGDPVPLRDTSNIYLLRFVRHNIMDYRLVTFLDTTMPFNEIVDRCKDYCARNNFRFIWIEPALEL